jgi:hypothetical protein
MIACPCCKGSGWLTSYLFDDPRDLEGSAQGTLERRDLCTHCMGQGEIATQLDPKAAR